VVNPDLVDVLSVPLSAIIFTLLMAWLDISRSSGRAGTANVLRYPRSILVLGGVCGGGFLAAAALSFFDRGGGVLVALGFLGFASLGVYLTLEYLLIRVDLGPEGLSYRTIRGRSGFLAWQDVRQVSWSRYSPGFVLRSLTGETVRVSSMLRGLPSFATAVLSSVPRERLDDRAASVLENVARGILPDVG
jgi:hypothetical protein